jgi:type I restriction enzyme, S subunit
VSAATQVALPEGWTRVRFGDVVRNKNFTTKDPEKDGLDRIVGLTHLDSESLPIVRWDILEDETSFSRTFAAGDVLFGKRRAYQRKVGVPDFAGVCSGDILVFESKDPSLLQEFLPYIVQSDAFFERAVGTSAGSLSPRTNWTQLARFEFALPPIEEQRPIVEVLDAIDGLTALMEVALGRATGLLESTFSQLFVGAEANRDVYALGDVVAINPEPRSSSSDLEAFRYIDIASVSAEGGVDRTSLQVHTVSSAPSRAQRIVRNGDILVSTVRPSLRAVARVEGDLDGEVASTGFAVLRPGPQTSSDFIWGVVRSEAFVQHLVDRATGSNYPAVRASDVGGFPLPLPDLKEQRRISQIVRATDNQTHATSSHISDLRQLRSSLLSALLTGDKRLHDTHCSGDIQ